MSQSLELQRPGTVVGAVTLLILNAVGGAMSVHILFWLAPQNKGWVLPFQPGVWILCLIAVLLALFIYRGVNWARWLTAVLAIAFLAESLLTSSWPAKYATYPAATVRDALSYVVQAVAVVQLYLPSSSRWFRRASAKRDA